MKKLSPLLVISTQNWKLCGLSFLKFHLFLLIKLLREENQIWFTCNSTTFGNVWNICLTKNFFQAAKGSWSFWYVKKPMFKQLFVFLKVDARWCYGIQKAWSKRPFYTMKMPFLLPWLQNRLQTISSKNFSMFKKHVLDENPLLL